MKVAWCALWLAACESGRPIEGIYQITYQTSNPQGCSEGPMMIQKPYFDVEKIDVHYGPVDMPFYDVQLCDDTPVGPNCIVPLHGALLDTATAGGWSGMYADSMPSNGTCTLEYYTTKASVSDTKLRLELTGYGDTVMLADSQCTIFEALNRGASMPCKSFDVVEGTRVR